MDARIAYALFQGLQGDIFTFGYSGAFHDEHTARLITIGEAALDDAGAARSARQRLAYVMVEAYQNIIRHRAPLSEDLARGQGRSIFLLRCHRGGQQVVAVNPVMRKDREELVAALEAIAGLDAAALKERFLNTLSREGPRQRGGAGLGLIEMARRSGQDLRHGIRGLGDDHLLFLLQVCFGEDPEIDRGIAMTALLSGTIVQQDILFLFKGPRLASAEEALLQLTEKDVDERNDRSTDRQRALLAAMGLLTQMVPPTEQAIITMARAGRRYDVVVGAVMQAAKAASFVDDVRGVNAMGEQARRAAYRDLMLGRASKADPLRLALLELARTSTEPIGTEVTETTTGAFVAVRVTI